MDVWFRDRSGNTRFIPTGLTMQLKRHSWRRIGGPDLADISVVGELGALWSLASMLRWDVRIYNDVGTKIWWGYVHEIDIGLGSVEVTMSLSGMSNRIAVSYNYENINGTQIAATTNWSGDTDSQNEYGIIEIIETLNDATETQAETRRDLALDVLKVPVISLGRGSGIEGTLKCRGWWHTLDWQHYSNTSGRIEHMPTGGTITPLQLGFTSSKIAFVVNNDVHCTDGKFDYFEEGTKATISGAGQASNNGVHTIVDRDVRTAVSYTATTIHTEPNDDIKDTAFGFGFVQARDVIEVSGFTESNHNGDHLVGGVKDNEHIKITTGYSNTLTTEAVGDTVTVKRGQHINTTGTTAVTERLGSSVTVLAHGQEIAQQINNNTGSAWTLDKIGIEIQKVGNTTNDVSVALYSDNSGSIGTLIEAATIDDTDIGTTLTWRWATFGNTNTLASGTDYWIKISCAGTADAANFYYVGIAEDSLYADGDFKLYDDTAWYDRPTTASLRFRIWGAEETTDLISTMLNDAQFVDGVNIQTASGVNDNQYRDGSSTILTEIERLIEMGNSTNRLIVSEMRSDRSVHIWLAPLSTSIGAVLYNDGTLRDRFLKPFDQGQCIVGQWVALAELPSHVGSLSQVSPFFSERCEYNSETGEYTLEARGAQSPWEL